MIRGLNDKDVTKLLKDAHIKNAERLIVLALERINSNEPKGKVVGALNAAMGHLSCAKYTN